MPNKLFLESNQFNVNVSTIFLQYLSIQICYLKGPRAFLSKVMEDFSFKTNIFQQNCMNFNSNEPENDSLGYVRLG
jgi:hypothetical protein